jgi:hypothetical protein
MQSDREFEGAEIRVPRRSVPIAHRRVDWPHVALLGAALTGLWIAGGLAIWAGEPSQGAVKLYTGSAMVIALVVLGIAIQRLMSAPNSRLHYVFRGRHMVMLGGGLVLVTALVAGWAIHRGLFGHLSASGRFDARDIADAGFTMALVVCAVGAGMAMIEARETINAERNWHRSLGISLR